MSSDAKFAILQFANLVVLAAIAHMAMRRYFVVVCLGVSFVGNLLAMLVVAPLFGLTSNIWPLACAFWLLPGAFVAAIVGIPFLVARRKPPPGHCSKCGYALTGNESGTCPECGASTGKVT
jgi:predicted membrane protein